MDADWAKIKKDYIQGGISYRKLADKHGVPYGTLVRRAVRDGWREAREQAAQKASAKMVDMEAERQAKRMERLLKVSDKLLDAVEEAVDSFCSKELQLDKTALRSLSASVKDIKDIQSIKSKLDIEEQRARIANLQRQAQEADKQEAIKVIIADELDDYGR